MFTVGSICDNAWQGYSPASGEQATRYCGPANPVKISLTENISLSSDTTLTITQPFKLDGNTHSIDLNGHTLTLVAGTVEIDNVKFINGTVNVNEKTNFSCTNSTFTNSSGEGTAIALKKCTIKEITNCKISGFDTGISLDGCYADSSTNTFPDNAIVVSGCTISDCNNGINVKSGTVAILNTKLTAKPDTTGTGVDTNDTCYLIDCDINDFDSGYSTSSSSKLTIISCIFKNKSKNLVCPSTTYVYDTRFIGGENSVVVKKDSYFYGCVVEGIPDKTIGFSTAYDSHYTYIFGSERHYHSDQNEYDTYDALNKHSERTVNALKDGKSEIFNCKTGVENKYKLYIADTDIHDCTIGIVSNGTSSSSSVKSYGNNEIAQCTTGMDVNRLNKNIDVNDIPELPLGQNKPDEYVDIIHNCSDYGINSGILSASYPYESFNRLEIYECGIGINVSGYTNPISVDIHNCTTGIYITNTATKSVILDGESKVQNNSEWNVYNDSNNAEFRIQGSEGTLKGGGEGNVSSKKKVIFIVYDSLDFTLNSDDSEYYLGTKDVMFEFKVDKLDGTIVFDTVDDGYLIDRKVAELKTDITSQMFAKKEGYVIKYEEDAGKSYAVFAAGCDVTYDVTTNGGDTFDGEKLSDEEIKDGKSKRISYLNGAPVDLTYKASASKPGYTFVGWNTDKNATEGLETLTAGEKDITLYAIYEKAATITYHIYDTELDYSTDVTFYNNEDEIECELAAYNADGDKNFAGYVLNEDAVVSSADDLLKPGDKVTVSLEGLDVYCVYSKQGQLKYLKKDGTTLSTESKTVYEIGSDNKKFVYTVRAGEPVEGFTFTGWKDAVGKSYAAGATLSTEDNLIVLTPVYVENAEPTPEVPTPEVPTPEVPTPEEPTPEVPTPEVPTPEVPTPGDPVIQPPTTEASTTQAPAGPKTGDSTNPIGVIGLGILSLLGILILTMKNKRKN